MKISYSNIDRLNRWDSFQLLEDVIIYANSLSEEMPELYTNKLAELEAAFKTYDDALVQEKKASSDALLAAEDGRDHAVRKMYALIKEYSDFPYEEQKETAAKYLLEVFKPYGTGYEIAAMAQDTETGVLSNLLQDFDKETAENHAVELNLQHVLDQLRNSNATFAELQRNRNTDQSLFVAGVVKNARTNAQNEFIEFVNVVNALAIVEGEEKYTELKQKVNTLMKKYVDRTKQRTKKKEEQTEPEVTE